MVDFQNHPENDKLVGMFNMNAQGMDMPLHSGSSGNVDMLGLSGGGSSANPTGIVLTMNSLVIGRGESTLDLDVRDRRTLFKCRQLDDLFHTLKTVKGLLHLVPLRSPWISGYGVLYTYGLCYMLFL